MSQHYSATHICPRARTPGSKLHRVNYGLDSLNAPLHLSLSGFYSLVLLLCVMCWCCVLFHFCPCRSLIQQIGQINYYQSDFIEYREFCLSAIVKSSDITVWILKVFFFFILFLSITTYPHYTLFHFHPPTHTLPAITTHSIHEFFLSFLSIPPSTPQPPFPWQLSAYSPPMSLSLFYMFVH